MPAGSSDSSPARRAGAPVNVAILGCGNVGGALVHRIVEHRDQLTARVGTELVIAGIAVRDPHRVRSVPVPASLFTDDAAALVADPGVDVVVEVMGGVEPARRLVLDALAAGKPVVSANKELVATVGEELFAAAATAGVDFLFEASVAGGIPLIRPLRESLAGDRIRRVVGIVNGTTNYILSRMAEEGSSFEAALAEAQALGYAERDPTADVEGFDAAAKVAIVASIAFGATVVAGDVYREGITAITAADIEAAARLGYVVKLLAVAEEVDGAVGVRVHPAMVPVEHPLASVRDAFNAVFIEADAVGELMLYGRGAGGDPTASAVLGDLVDAARNLHSGTRGATVGPVEARPIRPIDDVVSQCYVRLDALDQPGVLARIAGCFGEHGVSILSMEQEGRGAEARLVLVTHGAREADVVATIAAVRELDVVARVGTVLRVVGGTE